MQANQLRQFETEPIGRLLLRYSIPAIVGNIVMATYNIIDRIFIGQGVGPEAIAGLGITFPVMNISTAFGVLVGVGGSSRVSILLGEKNYKMAQRVLGNALVLTIGIALAYIACFAVFIDDFLYMFGADEQTLPYAHDYLIYLLPGFLFINLSYSFNNYIRSSGYPRKAMITMFIGAVVNVILDPIFIFGLNMGIKGAAIATDIAMGVSMVWVMAHLSQEKHHLHFTRGIYKLQWGIVASIFSIGAAPFLINITHSFVGALINHSLLRWGGYMAIAAASIFNTFGQILVMVIIGLCQGMQPIVGYNYGARIFSRLRRTYTLTAAAASAICIVGTAIAIFCPTLIARAFTADDTLIDVTDNALRIAMSMFWLVGFQIVSTNFFQSIGKAWKSIFLSLTRQILFLIPLVLTVPLWLGLDGVWASFAISDVISTIIAAAMIVAQFRYFTRLTTSPAPST